MNQFFKEIRKKYPELKASWECGDCGESKDPSAVIKLNQYFINALQVGDR